jgi:hypothetical protein
MINRVLIGVVAFALALAPLPAPAADLLLKVLGYNISFTPGLPSGCVHVSYQNVRCSNGAHVDITLRNGGSSMNGNCWIRFGRKSATAPWYIVGVSPQCNARMASANVLEVTRK